MIIEDSMYIVWMVFGVFLFALGYMLYVAIIEPYPIHSTFENLPTSKIAHMPIGMVEVKGLFSIGKHIDIPYSDRHGFGYHYMYFKGIWNDNGTKSYILDHESRDFSEVLLQDDTGCVAIDASVLQIRGAPDPEVDEILLGNDLVRIKVFRIPRGEHALVGYYQVDSKAGPMIVGDKKDNQIFCLSDEDSQLLQNQAIHRPMFRSAQYFALSGFLMVAVILITSGSNSTAPIENYMSVLFSYFIGNLVIFFLCIPLGISKESNLFINTLGVAFFPNILILFFGMFLKLDLGGLVLSVIILIMLAGVFCAQFKHNFEIIIKEHETKNKL